MRTIEQDAGSLHDKLAQGVPATSPPPQRYLKSVLVVVSILLLGAAATRLISSQSRTEESPPAAAQAGQPAQPSGEEFVYFPSQYVNQATEIEPHIEAF